MLLFLDVDFVGVCVCELCVLVEDVFLCGGMMCGVFGVC